MVAALDEPRAHKNPKTRGINAPQVKKSDAIHEMVRTDWILSAINKDKMLMISVDARPIVTVLVLLAVGLI